jgi:uncharacterized BrkB/YihY/UPF0761 family membrane protein
MRWRFRPKTPLGALTVMVTLLIIAGLLYLFWRSESSYFADPSEDSPLHVWHMNQIAFLIVVVIITIVRFFIYLRGRKHPDRDDIHRSQD